MLPAHKASWPLVTIVTVTKGCPSRHNSCLIPSRSYVMSACVWCEGLLNGEPQSSVFHKNSSQKQKQSSFWIMLTGVGKELANSSQGHFHCSTQHLQGSSNHSEVIMGRGEVPTSFHDPGCLYSHPQTLPEGEDLVTFSQSLKPIKHSYFTILTNW